jgi:molybdenum cofactor guanylyltransferase
MTPGTGRVPRSNITRVSDAAGIVLAGGRSSRMGSAKAALEWHGSTLLRRVTGIVRRSVDGPVIVVRAPGQELPELDRSVEVVQDAREGRGPLQGLAAGLEAIRDRAPAAYVSSTDVPLLHPAFIRRVFGLLADGLDLVLPEVGGYPQPLAAAYRASLHRVVEELVADGRLRPAFLFDRCRVLRVGERELLEDPLLARVDPELASVVNLNERSDYERARALPPPAVAVQRFGTLAAGSSSRREVVHAWTLGATANAVGLTLDEHVVAALNGDQISHDPELPLASGDTLAFLAADAGG